MSAFLFQMAVNLLEYWIIILLMQYVCSAHINLNRKNTLICSGISLLAILIAIMLPTNDYNFIVCFSVAVTLTVFLFSKKKFSDLLRFFLASAIYFALTVAPESMLQELIPATNAHFLIGDYSVRLLGLAMDVTLFALLILLRHLLIKYETTLHFRAKEILGSIALLFFSFIDIGLVMFLNYSQLESAYYYLFATIFVGAFIFSVGYYVYSLFESRARIYRQSVARNENEYLRLRLDALQDIKENEEHVKRMRHDLASHLAVIDSLCEEGNYSEVRKYTGLLNNDVILSKSKILTENKIGDLIVSSKMKVCETHGISFTFEGSLKNLDAMTAPDICGLLSNAYDNAIEACLNQQDAYIHTKVSVTRNYTVIRIVNSVQKQVPIRGNGAVTTKKDKKSHGYGIDIMKRIAHNYNGSCTFRCDDHEFEVKIVLLT